MTDKKLPTLIGISGKAGSGKDLAAAYLARAHGYQPLAFADFPKLLLQEAFGFSPEQLYGDLKEVDDPRFGKSPRYCLQYLLEAFRHCWPEIWVTRLAEEMDCLTAMGFERLVVTDVRLFPEARFLSERGAKLIRLERQGAGAQNGVPDHHTETELDAWAPWDLLIYNNGTLKDLHFWVEKFLAICEDDLRQVMVKEVKPEK